VSNFFEIVPIGYRTSETKDTVSPIFSNP